MKKICVVVASRANYARVKHLMLAIKSHPNLQLQLIVGASTLLERFGKVVNIIKEDGFSPDRTIHYVIEGETLTTQAKSTGLGILELSSAFEDLAPDAIITVADRFETMATAIASAYMNIPLIHLQGGELSGNIDDRVRHAITKLSDYHFVSSELSAKRVLSMGEKKETIFCYGCPSMDILLDQDLSINNSIMAKYKGVGKTPNWEGKYILILQHPVTTSYGNGFSQISETLKAAKTFTDYQKIILWPNIDAGSDDVSKGIRVFRESKGDDTFSYFKNFSPEDYARLLCNAVCCVGNSSSFLREGAFLGVPAVIIGDRQLGREHGDNVLFSDYVAEKIVDQLNIAKNLGKLPSDIRFGAGDAGVKIANQLSLINFNVTGV